MRTNIASKVYVSFGVMAAMVVAGTVGLLQVLPEARTNYERLSQNTHAAAWLADAQSAFWELRYDLPQFMTGDAVTREKVLAEESSWYAQIDEALEAYGRLDMSDDARHALAKLRESYQRYVEARPHWFELYANGKLDEAEAWRTRTTTPYGAATVQRFSELIELQRKSSEATEQKMVTHTTAITRVVMVFTLVSVVAAALVAFFMARTFISPLAQLVGFTRGVSSG